MKRIKIIGACVVAAAAVGAALAAPSYADPPDSEGFGPLSATPFSASGTTPAVSADSLVAKELAVLTNQGISPTRAKEALDIQSKVAQTDLPSKLQAAMGGAFAGVWFENTVAHLYVGAASPAGRRTAEGVVARAGLTDHVTIAPVRSTTAQLFAEQRRWNRKLASLFAREQVTTAIEPQRNAVSVTLSSSVPAQERAALEREAATSAVSVFVTVSANPRVGIVLQAKECNNFVKENANCNPSITAGVEIWSKIKCKKVANQLGARFFKTQKECETKTATGKEGEWEREKKFGQNPAECTGGPAAIPEAAKKERVLLTAGHCIETGGGAGIEWFAFTRALAEPLIGKAIAFKVGGKAGEEIGDYGDITIEPGGGWQTGNAATPVLAVTAEWKKAEETRYKVKELRVAAVKNMDCHEGATSGEQCGEVTAVNFTGKAENGNTVEGLVEDTAKGEPGDSGGPWQFVATENNPNNEAAMEGTHVGELANKRTVFEPLKKVEAGPQGSLEALKLELLTTANEVIKTAPLWSIGGKRLEAGHTHNIVAKAANEEGLKLEAKGVGITLKCTTVESKGGVLAGSKEGEPGTANEILVLSKCTTTGNGEGCKASEPIESKHLKAEQVTDSTGKKLDTLFTAETGETLATLKFTGEKCTLKEGKVTGQMVTEDVTDPGEEVIEMGQESKEAKSWDLRFPTTPLKEITKYKAEKEEVAKVKELLVFGESAVARGVALVSLANSKFETEETNWSPLP